MAPGSSRRAGDVLVIRSHSIAAAGLPATGSAHRRRRPPPIDHSTTQAGCRDGQPGYEEDLSYQSTDETALGRVADGEPGSSRRETSYLVDLALASRAASGRCTGLSRRPVLPSHLGRPMRRLPLATATRRLRADPGRPAVQATRLEAWPTARRSGCGSRRLARPSFRFAGTGSTDGREPVAFAKRRRARERIRGREGVLLGDDGRPA
jgi:hypothetical protein